MLISFFEEFPTKQNLAKVDIISWPTKLYLAASSLKKFQKIKNSIKNNYVKEVIWWPTLKKSEGYYFSPFSKRSGLKRIMKQLKKGKIPVMIDAELPTRQNPILYLTEFVNFFHNRQLLRELICDNKAYVAEYYPESPWSQRLFSFLGLHAPPSSCVTPVIKMLYHSMHNYDMEAYLKTGLQQYGKNFIAGFGTIYPGMIGSEPLLDSKVLDRDLKVAKKLGVKEIVMFRLGGLNKEYKQVLTKHSS